MQSRGNRTGAAKNMALEDISYQISIGDMDVAEELADKWSDLCTLKRIQNELDPTLSEDHNSFDAVSIIKRKLTQRIHTTYTSSIMVILTMAVIIFSSHQSR